MWNYTARPIEATASWFNQIVHDSKHTLKLLVPHLIVVKEPMSVLFVVCIDPILVLENGHPHWTKLQWDGLWMFVFHALLCFSCVYLMGSILPCIYSHVLLLWVPLVLHYLTHANLDMQLQLLSIIQKSLVSLDSIFFISWFEWLCINLIPVYFTDIDFLVASKMHKYTSLCLTPSLGICFCGSFLSTAFVDLTCCHCCFMCPFGVLSDSEKNLCKAAIVSPGKVVKLPLFIALNNVAFIGNLKAACRNQTTLTVEGNSYTLCIACFGTSLLIATVSWLFYCFCWWERHDTIHSHFPTLWAYLCVWLWLCCHCHLHLAHVDERLSCNNGLLRIWCWVLNCCAM